MGKLTMRQLIEEVCGGLVEGKKLKGVIPGGSSMPVLKADNIDVPLDFESLRKAGTMAGSGGIVVIAEDVNIVDATLNVAQFYAHESCGQCTPCREGTLWMEKLLHRMQAGQGRPEDVDLLFDVADNIDGKTICPLGEAAAWPVKAFLKNYRSEFEAACKKMGARMGTSTPSVLLQRSQTSIHVVRGERVMLSTDVANLYGVTEKALNQAVKRNMDRFPRDFMFQLERQEAENLRSQFVTSSSGYGGRRYLPYALTEQGVAMLSSVLRSPTAVRVNIEIMRTFVRLRRLMATPGELVEQLRRTRENDLPLISQFRV